MNRNNLKYLEIKRNIRRGIKEANESQLDQFCREIKHLQKTHDALNLRKAYTNPDMPAH